MPPSEDTKPRSKLRPDLAPVQEHLQLDPQGKAIEHALAGLGFGGVAGVRAGKIFELDVADDTSDAEESKCAWGGDSREAHHGSV